MKWLIASLSLATFACSTTSAAPDAGTVVCQSGPSPGPATPAPGGGVCCEVGYGRSDNCGAPPVGGWAATLEGCCAYKRLEISDLTYTDGVDSHGCHILVPGCSCLAPGCGLPDGGIDASESGIDAADDATDGDAR